MTYTQALDYIRKSLPAGSKPGLERTQALLSAIGNPQRDLKFVHIAGTNGKGSVASMTASILTSSGYKTGLFTSPAIFEFNDHIRIDGVNISNRRERRVGDHVAGETAGNESDTGRRNKRKTG